MSKDKAKKDKAKKDDPNRLNKLTYLEAAKVLSRAMYEMLTELEKREQAGEPTKVKLRDILQRLGEIAGDLVLEAAD